MLKRIQPFVGGLILVMGFSTMGLVLRKGVDSKALAQLGTGALMAAGGIGLVFRAPTPKRTSLAVLVVSAALVAAALYAAR